MSVFDTYGLRARVAPVFIVLIPAILAIAAWTPGALSLEVGGAATVVGVGLATLVAQFGRDLGKRKEPVLWRSWGGPPTTRFLRHGDKSFNTVLRARYHSRLRELQPNLGLPTADEEKASPERADEIYGAATRYLITRTRDTRKFPLVFRENVNYGFRRNLWGLRPFGIAVSALGTSACVLRLWLVFQASQIVSPGGLIGILIGLMFIAVWLFWVTPSMVKIAAEAYAERLLETCDQL